jgi:hypothetical protein
VLAGVKKVMPMAIVRTIAAQCIFTAGILSSEGRPEVA